MQRWPRTGASLSREGASLDPERRRKGRGAGPGEASSGKNPARSTAGLNSKKVPETGLKGTGTADGVYSHCYCYTCAMQKDTGYHNVHAC